LATGTPKKSTKKDAATMKSGPASGVSAKKTPPIKAGPASEVFAKKTPPIKAGPVKQTLTTGKPVRKASRIPTDATRRALDDVKTGRVTPYADEDDLFARLGITVEKS
jgi:hypothetical protein